MVTNQLFPTRNIAFPSVVEAIPRASARPRRLLDAPRAPEKVISINRFFAIRGCGELF